MSMRLKWLKQILTLACAIGAYLSILYVGGFMVFGFRSFLEFCLFFVPVLTFPVTLVAWLSVRAAASLFALIVICFYGAQMRLVGPSLRQIVSNHTHLLAFSAVGLLLFSLVIIDLVVRVRVGSHEEAV